MNIYFFRIFFCLLFISIFGCKWVNSGDVLPIDKMKVVFLHQIMAEEMFNYHYAEMDTVLNLDSLNKSNFEKILQLNGTDSATFFRSLAYYKADVSRLKRLFDSTHSYAERLREELYNKKDEGKESGTEKNAESMDLNDSTVNTTDSLVN